MTDTRPSPEDLYEIGQFRAPYGLKGWLWLYSGTDPIENVFDYVPWLLEDGTSLRPVRVKSWRTQGKGLVVLLDGVEDRTGAEALVGRRIYIPKTALPPPAEDEYYWSDLKGMKVFGIDGSGPDSTPLLGEVSHLFETGAHDIMVVKPCTGSIDQEERLIPWHRDTILKVDSPARSIYTHWAPDY